MNGSEYQYVVWFRNPARSESDEDYEWPACFLVAAESETEACRWADSVARDYASRSGQLFLQSFLDSDPWPSGSVRRIVAGSHVRDSDIGW